MLPRMIRSLAFVAALLAALAVAAAPNDILGQWRGTSLCVDKEHHPACNDEVIVYDFTPSKTHEGEVTLSADKIVNGERVTMYVLDFHRNGDRWSAEFRNARVHILWSYAVDGDSLTGTLCDFDDRTKLLRNVKARREKQ